MSDSGRELNKRDMEQLLTDFANRIYQMDPNAMYEVYIVGGAAMVLYYNTRYSSRDIDVSWVGKEKIIKRAIVDVANFNGIDKAWLNNDYEKSESYTKAIFKHSELYTQICNVKYFIVRPELALCMKIISFRVRQGKYDVADANNMVSIMRQNGVKVTFPIVIEWLETFYKPVPELRAIALGFMRDLGY